MDRNPQQRARRALATIWIGPLMISGILAGCASRGIVRQEYLLTSLASSSMEAVAASGSEAPAIGVGPVAFPGYLRRPQIVTRDGNRLSRSERHFWGEDLEADFARVLAENLAVLIPTNQISTFPWSDPRVLDYSIAVQVSRFDRDADDTITLLAQWKVVEVQTGATLKTARTSIGSPETVFFEMV